MHPKPILKGDTRVLRPSEFAELREGARSLDNRTLLDGLLLTGVRYVEGQRLQKHPDWFDSKFIHLPQSAQKKVKRQQRERWVKLSSKGVTIVPYLFKTKQFPSWKSWTEDLQRWAEREKLDPIGLGPKSLRKSWESWLITCFPEQVMQVCLSQGHTMLTSLQHYVNLPFASSDREAMQEYVSGWDK